MKGGSAVSPSLRTYGFWPQIALMELQGDPRIAEGPWFWQRNGVLRSGAALVWFVKGEKCQGLCRGR